jgi:hypothetical protein
LQQENNWVKFVATYSNNLTHHVDILCDVKKASLLCQILTFVATYPNILEANMSQHVEILITGTTTELCGHILKSVKLLEQLDATR